MRIALKFFVPVAVLAVCGSASPVSAAPSRIDPDPRSLTLGELMDREQRIALPVPRKKPAPRVVRQPVVPQEAVTVIVPGGRLRAPPKPMAR
jgi:hypothetical protein